MGDLRVLSWRGDTKITWRPDAPEEVRIAEAAFVGAMSVEGTRAYRLEGALGRKRGQEITTFEPGAERILLVPPMQGG